MSIGYDEPFTQSLLLAAYQDTAAELLTALRRARHPAIRHKHGAVFANLDAGGTRPSVLADRAGITRAALGELVDELVHLGYVQRRPDPSDRRAKLVVPTAAAREVVEVVRQVNEQIEHRYRAELGDDGYAGLRNALLAIVPDARVTLQPRMGARVGPTHRSDGASRSAATEVGGELNAR